MTTEHESPFDARFRRLVRKPFKGLFYYEWQIGPVVFCIRHGDPMPDASPVELRLHRACPRIKVWRDPYWWMA